MSAFRDEQEVCGFCRERIEEGGKVFGEGHLHAKCEKRVGAAYEALYKTVRYKTIVRCATCGSWRERVLAFFSKMLGTGVVLTVLGLASLGIVDCSQGCGAIDHCTVEGVSHLAGRWTDWSRVQTFKLTAVRHASFANNDTHEVVGEFPTLDDALDAAKKYHCPIR